MKQTLLDIGIWEAFETSDQQCPICNIEEKHENKLLKTIYSEMIMDKEFTQNVGIDFIFCKGHFTKLYKYPDKLGLALIIEKLLKRHTRELEWLNGHSILSKMISTPPEVAVNKLIYNIRNTKKDNTCIICSSIQNKINEDMVVLINLWSNSNQFREIYKKTKGFCANHFKQIIDHSENLLNGKEKKSFQELTYNIQQQSMELLQQELDWFIKKFDYKYKDLPWGNSKDSLSRSLSKLIGNFDAN